MNLLSKAVFIMLSVMSLSCLSNDTTRTNSIDEMRLKYALSSSQFVEIDGIDIHYSDEGKGPAVLLIHGTLGDLVDWSEWAPILSENYRVLRLDLPGFGLSGAMPNGNYSIDRMLSLIDAFMDYVGEENFSIAGISYGGIIAFRYAATRIERTSALVLINSAGIQTGKQRVSKKKNTKEKKPQSQRNFMVSEKVTRDDIEKFYETYINDPATRGPELIQRKLDFVNIINRDGIAKQISSLYERGNSKRVLSHVKAPSLVVWGTGNNALDTSTANEFVNALKNASKTKLVTVKDAGHYINIEKPKITAEVTKTFLNQTVPR